MTRSRFRWPAWLERARSRHVVIAHTRVDLSSRPDDLDTLEEVSTVATALREQGFDPLPVPFTLDLRSFEEVVRQCDPALVFNLVEAIEASGRLIHLAPAVCEHLGVAYTGSSAAAVLTTTNKLETKRLLRHAGLPTPRWVGPAELAAGRVGFPGPYILKPVWEDASVGIDHDSVCPDAASLVRVWRERTRRDRCELFAERFVDGRELNLSILAVSHQPRVLPPAEIEFVDWEEGAPRIVGWRAKWDENAAEFERTQRGFFDRPEDRGLHRRLGELARRCWHLFGLRGYARVDLRVDRHNRAWILEVNANPCISPDAGFLAAAREAGLEISEVIARIIADCEPPLEDLAGLSAREL